MARIEQFLCDYCNKVVSGYDKTAVVKKKYIQFRGSFMVEDWDKENDRRIFFYVTPTKNSELSFCDLKCLEDYISRAEKEFKKRYKKDCLDGKYDRGYYVGRPYPDRQMYENNE